MVFETRETHSQHRGSISCTSGESVGRENWMGRAFLHEQLLLLIISIPLAWSGLRRIGDWRPAFQFG
jgi:hypothetical protein